MANVVLDASAVVRIIEVAEPSAPFQEAVQKADLVLAPELMHTEVANAVCATTLEPGWGAGGCD
jgi:predicted nucleic acid-binding protein